VGQAPGLRRALSPPNGRHLEMAVSSRIIHLRMSSWSARVPAMGRLHTGEKVGVP
jgi:hypothetical protein